MKDLLAYKFPLNIQLFAEEGDEANKEADNKDDKGGTGAADKDQGNKPKTFTQDEVNALIGKEKAKFQKKIKDLSGDEEKKPGEGEKTQENPFIQKYAQAEIKASMMSNGIDPSKVARAVRLIDTTEVINETGEVDAEKLNKAIADLLKDWPELKATKDDQKNGFKIGGDKEKDKGNAEDLIAKAFGNKK